jgi:hypothetical protein
MVEVIEGGRYTMKQRERERGGAEKVRRRERQIAN